MPKKQSDSKSQRFRDIQSKLKTFVPLSRNGWVIKLSTYGENILLLFHSPMTGQSFVRYYDDEDDAVDYINIIVTKNSNELLPLE